MQFDLLTLCILLQPVNYIRDTATIFNVVSSIYGTGINCQMGSMDRDFSIPMGIISIHYIFINKECW